jgi:PAS domain S-box-containing protein
MTNARLEQPIARRSVALKTAQDAESEVKSIAAEQKAILDSHIIGIAKIREDRTVGWVNPAFATMFGDAQSEIIGKSTRFFYRDDEAFDAVGRDAYKALASDGSYRREQEYWRKDGSSFISDVNGTMLATPARESIWCFVDISDRKRHEEAIRQLAFFDPLTRLPNRRLFNDRLAHALAHSERNKFYGSLVVLDLDNFKPLNDTHGHAAGDLLLQQAARRISACVRETDAVARFGGDEFVIICGPLVGDRDRVKLSDCLAWQFPVAKTLPALTE